MGTSSGSTSTSIVLRFSNLGGSALTVDKSKPPIGGAIFAENPDTEFTEALSIAPNSSATATVLFQPPIPVLNAPDSHFNALWTLNTNDVNFGVHVVNFTGTAISKKAGPMTANGNALYQYLGCYQDSVNVRIEAKGYQNANQNTNGLCQNQSYAAGAVFAGSEFQVECWVGNAIPNPNLKVSDALCNYQCAGDPSQVKFPSLCLENVLNFIMHRYAAGMVASCHFTTTQVATFLRMGRSTVSGLCIQ